jgi:ubiquinone/menaquinone biosynthesis C-methylase UbiE
MASESRIFSEGSFDFFDEVSESLLGWLIPGGPHTTEMLQQAGIHAHSRLLDVGCGTGRLLARAARREPSAVLVGIDTDRDSITIARERARNAPAQIELHLASAERMPFSDHYFDVATAGFVLGAMRKHARDRVLGEVLRVVKPGGRILVLDWLHPGCFVARLAVDALSALPVAGALSPRSTSSSIALLDRAGFEDVVTLADYCTIAGTARLVRGTAPLGA